MLSSLFSMMLQSQPVIAAQPLNLRIASRADICMNCSSEQARNFARKLTPGDAKNGLENYVYLVDPVNDSYHRYLVEVEQNMQIVSEEVPMTPLEVSTFRPLMNYAKAVVELQRAAAAMNVTEQINSKDCDSALDSYSNSNCGGQVRAQLQTEASLRDIFSFRAFDYSMSLEGDARVLKGVVTISGQGADGIVRVTFNWNDNSRTVYKLVGQTLDLDLEQSVDSSGEPLGKVIAELERDNFSVYGVRGRDLENKLRIWRNHRALFCTQAPGYKLVQAELLQCRSEKAPDGVDAGGKPMPTVIITCKVQSSGKVIQTHDCN